MRSCRSPASGRVTDEDGQPIRGEYVVGWIKRGPSGVIGIRRKDASDTVAMLLAGRGRRPAQRDRRRR